MEEICKKCNYKNGDRCDGTAGIECPKGYTESSICPFCEEGDYDLEGLKLHLMSGQCEPFNQTIIPMILKKEARDAK